MCDDWNTVCWLILYSFVESALSVNILRSFQLQRRTREKEQELSSLGAIILFLKNEVQWEKNENKQSRYL